MVSRYPCQITFFEDVEYWNKRTANLTAWERNAREMTGLVPDPKLVLSSGLQMFHFHCFQLTLIWLAHINLNY